MKTFLLITIQKKTFENFKLKKQKILFKKLEKKTTTTHLMAHIYIHLYKHIKNLK
jgi:hypothetical protein